MKALEIISHNPKETLLLGGNLAKCVKAGDILCLMGDLGTGKTMLVKGMARGLKVHQSKVHSPTFILLNCYEGKLPLYHFDLYRLDDIKELGIIGYDEFLYDEGVAVIEWAERLKELMPKEYLSVRLTHRGKESRLIKLEAIGARYDSLIAHLGKISK